MSIETPKLKVRCPRCKEWARWHDNPFRPFCGEKCKESDLGNWATERYRVPVEEETPGEEVKDPTKTEKDSKE